MTTRLKIAGGAAPYSGDGEYLDEEARQYIPALVGKVLATQKLAQARRDEETGDLDQPHRPGRSSSHQARLELVDWTERERLVRAQIDERLAATRNRHGATFLGLDAVCVKAELNEAERRVLLIALLPCINPQLAEEVLNGLPSYFAGLSVANLISLLAPEGGVEQWLEYRKLFRPSSSRLISHGLLQVHGPSGDATASSLLCAECSVTLEALAQLTGDPDAMTEAD